MSGLFAGTALERPVTCEVCSQPLDDCTCPRGSDGHVRRPKDQRIVVRREKRKRGKQVTVARGFDPVASDLPGLVRQLQGRLATGGTVDGDAIEVRGDHVAAVVEWLGGLGYAVRSG